MRRGILVVDMFTNGQIDLKFIIMYRNPKEIRLEEGLLCHLVYICYLSRLSLLNMGKPVVKRGARIVLKGSETYRG